MKIEVGKYYKTRDGKKVGPMQSCFDLYHYDGSVGVFTGTGLSLHGRDIDLIAEWIDEPVTGTLRELNVQSGVGLGDVVWRGIGTTSSPSPVITETVTTQRIVPGVYGSVYVTQTEYGFDIELNTNTDNIDAITKAITTLAQIRNALTRNIAK